MRGSMKGIYGLEYEGDLHRVSIMRGSMTGSIYIGEDRGGVTCGNSAISLTQTTVFHDGR